MSLLDDDYNLDDYVVKSICVKKVENKVDFDLVKYEEDEYIDFSHLLENQKEYILGRRFDLFDDYALIISIFHRPSMIGAKSGIYSELFYLNPDWNMYNVLNKW